MKISRLIMFILLALLSAIAHADDYAETIKIFKTAESVRPFFSHSYGYAVFPKIGKGGLIIGGAFGRGRVYVNNKVIGTAKMSQVSIGAQLGGQAYSQIIFFEDKRAYQDFASGEFEFGANANAIAITSSAQAQSGTTGSSASAGKKFSKAGYHKGMIVFIRGRGGLMFEASIAGQKYKFKPLKRKE